MFMRARVMAQKVLEAELPHTSQRQL